MQGNVERGGGGREWGWGVGARAPTTREIGSASRVGCGWIVMRSSLRPCFEDRLPALQTKPPRPCPPSPRAAPTRGFRLVGGEVALTPTLIAVDRYRLSDGTPDRRTRSHPELAKHPFGVAACGVHGHLKVIGDLR